MESERKQRQQKREQIENTIEEEMLPLNTLRGGLTRLLQSSRKLHAHVSDLKDHIVSFVDNCDS